MVILMYYPFSVSISLEKAKEYMLCLLLPPPLYHYLPLCSIILFFFYYYFFFFIIVIFFSNFKRLRFDTIQLFSLCLSGHKTQYQCHEIYDDSLVYANFEILCTIYSYSCDTGSCFDEGQP